MGSVSSLLALDILSSPFQARVTGRLKHPPSIYMGSENLNSNPRTLCLGSNSVNGPSPQISYIGVS